MVVVFHCQNFHNCFELHQSEPAMVENYAYEVILHGCRLTSFQNCFELNIVYLQMLKASFAIPSI